ncbi:MAG: hypothetical protein HYS25_08845 [Ignavibacteriales bacterium]|nr:hypothetical protein [Ignavibacteriales bacterium]
MKENLVFFLGGHDAEMEEIRNILAKHNFIFFDKNLSWGAKASDYKEEIEKLKENETAVLSKLNNSNN